MKRLWLVSAIVCASVSWATSAHADAVTYWNAVTAEAVTAGRPGGAGFLDMALVHAAMHDAVQAIQQRFEPYAAKLKGSGSLEAAAGAAAYGVLVGIYPKQQGVFDAKYKEFLAQRRSRRERRACSRTAGCRCAAQAPPSIDRAARLQGWLDARYMATHAFVHRLATGARGIRTDGKPLPDGDEAVHAGTAVAVPARGAARRSRARRICATTTR